VHLVGITIEIYYGARSYISQKIRCLYAKETLKDTNIRLYNNNNKWKCRKGITVLLLQYKRSFTSFQLASSQKNLYDIHLMLYVQS
jgi:hypothetical protein